MINSIDASAYNLKNQTDTSNNNSESTTVTGKIDVNQSLSDKGLALLVHVDCDDNAFILKGLKDGIDVRIPKKELIKAIAKLM